MVMKFVSWPIGQDPGHKQHSLRCRVRSSVIRDRIGVDLLLLQIERSQLRQDVERKSLLGASWTPPLLRFLGTSPWVEAQGKTPARLCLSVGLWVPQASPSRAGEGIWGEGSLAATAETADTATPSWIKWKMSIKTASEPFVQFSTCIYLYFH